METKRCIECGNPLNRGARKYCSRECLKIAYRRTWVELACTNCGKLLRRRKIERKGYKSAFCDKKCECEYRSFGDNLERKGRYNDQGYKSVKVNGKYVGEHRLIMSDFIGRKLKRHEIVHHLNGIRDDNRIENLCIVTNYTHPQRTLVCFLQKRIKDLEEYIQQI